MASSPVCGNSANRHYQTESHGKRLTMVERARLEALAAFGNEGFDSLSMKKDDFHSKLQSSVSKTSSNCTSQSRALTRLERAKLEANSVFKNVELGQFHSKRNKRRFQEIDWEYKVPKKKNITRLQKARAEVDKAFENVSLSTIPKKRSRLEVEQIVFNSSKNCEDEKIGKKSACNTLSDPFRRFTRSQSGKRQGANYSEKRGLKSTTNEKNRLSGKEKESRETIDNLEAREAETEKRHLDGIEPKRLNRIERAKLEAIDSFKGEHFEEICRESKKIVAKHFNSKLNKQKQPNVEGASPRKSEKDVECSSVTSSHKKQATQCFEVPPLHHAEYPTISQAQNLFGVEVMSNAAQACNDQSNPLRSLNRQVQVNTVTPLHTVTENKTDTEVSQEAYSGKGLTYQKQECLQQKAALQPSGNKTASPGSLVLSEMTAENASITAPSQMKIVDADKIQQTPRQGSTYYPLKSSNNNQITPALVSPSQLKSGRKTLTVTSSANRKNWNMHSNLDVYSCINGEESFKDHEVLLETNKRVIETAISLETPEGSPVVTTAKK